MTGMLNSLLVNRRQQAALHPRFRVSGEVTLDLYERDARIADVWLNLTLLEFELFWRLAQDPQCWVSRDELLCEAWLMPKKSPHSDCAKQKVDGAAIDIDEHINRIRRKLQPLGLGNTIRKNSKGQYQLEPRADLIFQR